LTTFIPSIARSTEDSLLELHSELDRLIRKTIPSQSGLYGERRYRAIEWLNLLDHAIEIGDLDIVTSKVPKNFNPSWYIRHVVYHDLRLSRG